jgi:hypothetical protein
MHRDLLNEEKTYLTAEYAEIAEKNLILNHEVHENHEGEIA